MDKKELQQEIKALESKVANMQDSLDSMQENLNCLKDFIRHLKDIAWDRDSKKESSKMYKVLENDKSSTIVRSNVGDVIVDREFMEKEIHKHLDNPTLRGMVTTEEMLSFSKVAKNVEPEYDIRTKSYTWKVKSDDESVLRYGSREYQINENNINRLLTTYSETEYRERQDRGERGQLRQEFKDRDFLRPASSIIPQSPNNSKIIVNRGFECRLLLKQ